MSPAWHLPAWVAETLPGRRAIDGTGIAVPVLDTAQIASVWEDLDRAAAAWRAQPPAARVQRIAAAAAALRAAGPGVWSETLARSSGLSEAGLEAAWDVTFAATGVAALDAACAAEPDALGRGGARIVHIVSGNLLPPAWTMLVRGFLVGSPQWVRPAAREPLFAVSVAARLAAIDAELAATFAVLWWPHADDAVEPAVVSGARIVTVQGDDASVGAVTARVRALAPQARVVGYGTRWSAALVTRAAQTPRTAAALARDVALFDGQGCLSPALVLAQDGPELEAFCATFAAALAAEEVRLPRGVVPAAGRAALRAWRQDMRLGQALGTVRKVWESASSTAWAVALHARCTWPPAPLDRHVPVLPFHERAEVQAGLASRLASLQGLAVAWADWDDDTRGAWCAALGPTRVAPAGTLQEAPPGWRQDHLDPLGVLVV